MLSAIALSHYPLLYKERSPFPRYSREAIAFLIHHYFTKSDRLSLSTATSDRPINSRLLCMSDRLYLSTLFWQAIALSHSLLLYKSDRLFPATLVKRSPFSLSTSTSDRPSPLRYYCVRVSAFPSPRYFYERSPF